MNFFRSPPASPFCRFNLVIYNDGDEPATDMEVEGEVETVAEPNTSSKPVLSGPDEISAGGAGLYFFSLTFNQGDLMRYVVRMHNGGTSYDTISAPFGIFCTE